MTQSGHHLSSANDKNRALAPHTETPSERLFTRTAPLSPPRRLAFLNATGVGIYCSRSGFNLEQGVITGRHKTLHPGKIVTSFCIGSHQLYEFLHDNALFDFRPIEYVADPEVVARNHKMASLTQAFAIDLTGEVCADQFHGEFHGGVSTQLDFHRGAAASCGGKPIVCLRSTTDDGKDPALDPPFSQVKGSRWHARMCIMW